MVAATKMMSCLLMAIVCLPQVDAVAAVQRGPGLMRREPDPVEEAAESATSAKKPEVPAVPLHGGKEQASTELTDSVSNRAIVGGVLQLMARIFTALSLILQRAAATDDRKTLLWRVGIAVYLIFIVPDMLSSLLAPQAALTALSTVEPVLVLLFAWLLVPEDAAILSGEQCMGTVLCVAGTLASVLVAPVTIGSMQGSAAQAVPALNATTNTTQFFWDVSQGADRLFSQNGAHRLQIYLVVAVPLLLLLIQQAYQYRYRMVVGTGISSLHQFYTVLLMMIVAMSLALHRLAITALRVSLHTLEWQLPLAVHSPVVVTTATVATLLMLTCVYHVCQSISEVSPAIFVPLYCASSKLLELFQSVAIVQDYQGQSDERILLALACASISFLGVFHILMLQPEGRKVLPPAGQIALLLDCVETQPF